MALTFSSSTLVTLVVLGLAALTLGSDVLDYTDANFDTEIGTHVSNIYTYPGCIQDVGYSTGFIIFLS